MHLGASSSNLRGRGQESLLRNLSSIIFVGFVKCTKIHVTVIFILLFPLYGLYPNQCISTSMPWLQSGVNYIFTVQIIPLFFFHHA